MGSCLTFLVSTLAPTSSPSTSLATSWALAIRKTSWLLSLSVPTCSIVFGLPEQRYTTKPFLAFWQLTHDEQRFGNAITAYGVLNLKHARFAADFSSIEPNCTCTSCQPTEDGGLGITRAYIYHLAAKETVGAHLYKASLSSIVYYHTNPL